MDSSQKKDAFLNVTKHGLDVKMQAFQSMSVRFPVDAPGAKAYDQMQMNIFADVHKGAQMFQGNRDLSKYDTLEQFRNAASHRMTFRRKCMIEMSKIFLDAVSRNVHASDSVHAVVTPQQPNTGMYIPNTSSI
jgi:hypothetical protein